MKRKHGSIAKTIALRYAVLLFVVLLVMAVGAYAAVYRYTLDNARTYSEAAVELYATILMMDVQEKQYPLTLENADKVQWIGEYMCLNYNVDYTYLLIPDFENGAITYIDLSHSKAKEKEYSEIMAQFTEEGLLSPDDLNLHGVKIDYAFAQAELDAWNGTGYYAHLTMKNQFGNELCTMIRIDDEQGNSVFLGVDISYSSVLGDTKASFFLTMGVIFAVMALATVGLYAIVRRQVLSPAEKISGAMNDFLAGGTRNKTALTIAGDNEFSMIAGAFNSMTGEIDDYLERIGEMRSAEEKQQAEMEVTAKIQKGFLPNENYEDARIELHGVMQPAKEIGGDLFDYVFSKAGKLYCVVADVSGKGVSAAMFMSTTLTALRELAKADVDPSVILRETNRILCENNAEGLFVTAFLAVYDPETMLLTYSNAGHNLPYLLSGDVTPLDDAAGVVLGLFEGETYEQQTVKLHCGETLFLYTDGVSEAVNAEKRFFGEQRLEDCLRSASREGDRDLIGRVETELCAFTGEAEQHDDMTMLTLTVRERKELLLDVDVKEFPKVRDAVLACPVPSPFAREMVLAAEELFVNIVSYAYADGVPDGEKIRFVLERTDRLTLTFEDGGIPYDPLKEVVTADDYDMDAQEGGLGKLISFGIADGADYAYENGKNKVTIYKKVEDQPI